jgi:murein DD-endopeptidase MepM/ murein hydrolase activator NlpD
MLGCSSGDNGQAQITGGGGAASTQTAPASSTAATGTRVPDSLNVTLQPPQVGIGETMSIRAKAPNASAVVVEFRGASYRMLPGDPGDFWVVVGVPLDAPTGPDSLKSSTRDASQNVILSSDSAYQVVTVQRPVDYLELTDEEAAVTTPEAYAQEGVLRGLQFAQFDTGAPRWSELFLRPVNGEITTYFGQGRSINGGPVGAFHPGVDLANDEGTPVQVAAPGRVAWTGPMPIRGNSVIVDHGVGAKTGYHHLAAIQVDVGQQLERGSAVGLVGHTGLATGPHLHWELTLWGVNVDPMTWLTTSFGP